MDANVPGSAFVSEGDGGAFPEDDEAPCEAPTDVTIPGSDEREFAGVARSPGASLDDDGPSAVEYNAQVIVRGRRGERLVRRAEPGRRAKVMARGHRKAASRR